MADINDRLERLSRRDELARRVRQRALPPSITGVGEDFLEIVEAVAQVVRQHPGMSVMLAPGDGRRGSAVIRVTERNGEAEVAPVTVTGSPDDVIAPEPEPEPELPPELPPQWRPPGLESAPTLPESRRYDPTPAESWRWGER